MKLHRINQVCRLTPTDAYRRLVVLEGIIDDLLAIGKTKLQTMVHRNAERLESSPELRQYLDTAKELPVSLLKADPIAAKWWSQFFNHFSVPAAERQDLLKSMAGTLRSSIDRTREKPETQRTNDKLRGKLERGNITQAELNQLLARLDRDRGHGARKAESVIIQALDHIDLMEDVISEAGWGQKAAKFMDRDQRQGAGASAVIRANNERIAHLAVGLVGDWLEQEMQKATASNDEDRVQVLSQVLNLRIPPVVAQRPDEYDSSNVVDAEVVGPDQDIDQATGMPKEQLAQNLAHTLWKMSLLRATGALGKPKPGGDPNTVNYGAFGPDDAKDVLDQIKDLGYKIIWQGAKKPGYPQGDKVPKVRKIA